VRIGAHIHTAGGLVKAASYAAITGCECVQVFAKSPQMWRGPERDPAEAAGFVSEMRALGIGPVFTHAAYLINAGSADDALWERSRMGLVDELCRAAQLHASGVVLHMGTAATGDLARDAERVAVMVSSALSEAAARCEAPKVLLENTAGAGRSFGRDVRELCATLEACRAMGADAGLCLDTCHGFAAGWDLRGPQGWSDLCDALTARGALETVDLIHANDCKGDLGEHRDRHAWIGDGLIGAQGFSAMFGEDRLAGVPVIVEMPGEPPRKDQENVARLRSLRDAVAAAGAPGRGVGGSSQG
jgi:deoxyribonuclease-4